jgi:hypothetical protein
VTAGQVLGKAVHWRHIVDKMQSRVWRGNESPITISKLAFMQSHQQGSANGMLQRAHHQDRAFAASASKAQCALSGATLAERVYPREIVASR